MGAISLMFDNIGIYLRKARVRELFIRLLKSTGDSCLVSAFSFLVIFLRGSRENPPVYYYINPNNDKKREFRYMINISSLAVASRTSGP